MTPALAAVLALLVALPQASRAHTGANKFDLFQPPTIALDPEITLVVGPTLLFESGEWVTVSWSGIESWMYPDAFVAAFSPGSALDDAKDITDVAPVKYQFLTAEQPFPGDGDRYGDEGGEWYTDEDGERRDNADGNADGDVDAIDEAESAVGFAGSISGRRKTAAVESLRFRLLNLRDAEGYRFGLFKGGVEAPVLLAKTEQAVKFAQPFEVQHMHLSLTSDPGAMRVSWVTGSASKSPGVRFRAITSSDEQRTEVASWQVVAADSSMSYGRDDMCGAPATTKGFHDPGVLHSTVLSGLRPGQPYEYKAGDVDAQEWGKSAFFYAAPISSLKDPEDSEGYEAAPTGDPLLRRQAIAAAAAAAAATARARRARRRLSGPKADTLPPPKFDAEGAGGGLTWGPDAVKVAVFGDMGTADVDGSYDAGHSNEPPSLGTMKILKDHLRGVTVRSGARTVGGDTEALGGLGTESGGGGAEPQLGMVLHVGDLSYARGYDAQWDEFMDEIEPVASAVPWMVAMGNHERDYPTTSVSSARREVSFYTGTDSGGDCGVPTAFRFIMPGPAGMPLADSPWYGFDFGPVHFTVMSTEHDYAHGSEQYEFIEEDLANVDRTKTPWVVFGGHRPMYVNSGGPGAGDCEGAAAKERHCANDQPVAEHLRSNLERLLIKYEVNLAVYGHHHSYQRTCVVANEVCLGVSSGRLTIDDHQYRAPVHVVLGTAGMGLSQNMVSPRPEWLEYASDREHGLGMIVADSSKLQLTFIIDSTSQVGDEMILAASSSPPSPSPPSSSLRMSTAPTPFACLLTFVLVLVFA